MPLMYPTSLNLNAACLKQLGTRANIWKRIFMCVKHTLFDPLGIGPFAYFQRYCSLIDYLAVSVPT